jgi:capsular exopolysaccharide synthesis family protein
MEYSAESHQTDQNIKSDHNGYHNGYHNGHHNGYQNGYYSPMQLVPLNTLESQPENDLDLLGLIAILRRRFLVLAGVTIAVTATIWSRAFLTTPIFVSSFQILVEPVAAENALPGLASQREGLAQGTGLDYQTQIQVLRSPEILDPIVQELQSYYPNLSYGAVISNLSIARVGDTKILGIQYRDSDPSKVKKVLESIAKGYLNYSLIERQTSLRQGINFVEEQLPETRSRVESVQQALQDLQQEYQLMDPAGRSGDLNNQLDQVNENLRILQQNIIQAQSDYQDLQSLSGVAAALRQDSLYQQGLATVKDIEAKIALELANSRENSLEVQALKRQRDNLIPLLTSEAGQALNTQLNQTSQTLNALQQQQSQLLRDASTLQQQIAQLPALNRTFSSLQQELDTAKNSLDRLLAARANLQLESAQKEIPWQLLMSPELPGTPVSPNVSRSLTAGLMAGFILGVIAAFLFDRLDNVFHSLDQLREITKSPILGLVPYNQSIKEKVKAQSDQTDRNFPPTPTASSDSQPHSYTYHHQPFTEAFRTLAINLCFLSSDTPIRSLVVSSAMPGDGKSTVALHLAQAATVMGQRVLLVDADLRRPRIHEELSLFNGQGLSNLIASNLDQTEVIQPSGLEDNLTVITAGQLPPDPSRLLSSETMKKLMQDFRTQFDLVIYDTPPLLGLSEAGLLAAQADGIVVVVGLGKTNRSALKQVLEGLKTSRANVLGLVANALDQRTLSSSYDAYYYRYSHYYSVNNKVSKDKTDFLPG